MSDVSDKGSNNVSHKVFRDKPDVSGLMCLMSLTRLMSGALSYKSCVGPYVSYKPFVSKLNPKP